MHRGFMITFAASVNNARERMAESEIALKADGACNSLRSDICAEPCTDASTVAQLSKVMKPTIRMIFRTTAYSDLFERGFLIQRATLVKGCLGAAVPCFVRPWTSCLLRVNLVSLVESATRPLSPR